MERYALTALIITCITVVSLGQNLHNDCADAFVILDPIDYCSDEMQFSTFGSTPSGFGVSTCFTEPGGDVWFSFTAFATAINIVLEGTNGTNTLPQAQIALYDGSCTGTISELACGVDPNGNVGAISIFDNGLTIGKKYLIRVSGTKEVEGFFQICVNNYNPPIEPGQDCNTGSILCDKSPFVVQVLTGGGALPDEGDGTCLEGGSPNTITEDQSSWMKWTAANDGTLTFIITPLRTGDDIDFALFEISDIDACITTTPLRCVATSCDASRGLSSGLDMTSTDLTENFNCEAGEDSFVKFIDMEAGKHYGLLVNNFSSSSIGYSIEFGGTGEFLGPTADFSIDPSSGLRCDQDFIITDQSSFPNGNIKSHEWDFGERSIPPTAVGIGPHPVNYESFGEKFIVLTIVSDKGCRVTEVLPLTAEPCCDDVDMLDIELVDATDPICFDSEDGTIEVEGIGTNGEYSYSINGSDYMESPLFDMLGGGTYQVNVIDIKGCEDSLDVELFVPDQITVDAGPDETIELGNTTQLDGSFENAFNETICWSPAISLSDSTILDPEAFPLGTTIYTLSVKDESGCMVSDQVRISTEALRKIHAPNIFSPHVSDGVNDFFNLFGNRAVDNISELIVFDRYGNLMYNGIDIPHNQYDQGWDGKFNGRKVNPGVYTWYAKVRFIDGVFQEYGGDITVVE